MKILISNKIYISFDKKIPHTFLIYIHSYLQQQYNSILQKKKLINFFFYISKKK